MTQNGYRLYSRIDSLCSPVHAVSPCVLVFTIWQPIFIVQDVGLLDFRLKLSRMVIAFAGLKFFG